jgi:hypothetical protein
MMTSSPALDHLTFHEIWAVDGEWYPGAGLANGGVLGDLPTPLCLCAYEMRSGRMIRLWQDGLARSRRTAWTAIR